MLIGSSRPVLLVTPNLNGLITNHKHCHTTYGRLKPNMKGGARSNRQSQVKALPDRDPLRSHQGRM